MVIKDVLIKEYRETKHRETKPHREKETKLVYIPESKSTESKNN
jgi:hypothetical protein